MLPDQRVGGRRDCPFAPQAQLEFSRIGEGLALDGLLRMHCLQGVKVALFVLGQILIDRIGIGELSLPAVWCDSARQQD